MTICGVTRAGIGPGLREGFCIGLTSSVFFVLLLLSAPSSAHSGTVPFSPGETLRYEGRWGPIPAGEVTLEVLPHEMIAGVDAYHFAMTIKTNAVVDLIYRIRAREDSFVDLGLTRSLLYRKREESKHPRDVVVHFDWGKLEAARTNFGETSPPIHILPGTFDPLALLFILRLPDFKANPMIRIPVTDGDMNFDMRATVTDRDNIEIGGKIYPAFEVIPDMKRLDNLVKKSENPQLKIWYTADERKIPLRIESKVGIVSFVFELKPEASSPEASSASSAVRNAPLR